MANQRKYQEGNLTAEAGGEDLQESWSKHLAIYYPVPCKPNNKLVADLLCTR